jgi:formylglycine-generating enzyme required for sulfatase activity
VWVSAGQFSMGYAEGNANERPVHTVFLDGFWIDRTEVTNKFYALCVEAGACTPPSDTRSATRPDYYGNSQYDYYPVIFVSWKQAQAYCQWAGRQLPSEAQWEKAARGKAGWMYPWGNASPDSVASYFNNKIGDTMEVGKYPGGASPYAALDMAGNVWEWVTDWYSDAYYASSPANNPTGPTSGSYRSVRGGSGNNFVRIVRMSYRYWFYPDERYDHLGFRCASKP